MAGKLHKSTVVTPLHTSLPNESFPVSGSRNMLSKRYSGMARTFVFTAAQFTVAINLTLFGGCHVYGACTGGWKCQDTCAV